MWNMHEGFGWWAVFGSIWMLFLWGAVVWLVVSLVSRGSSRDRSPSPSAREIAGQRYARGEISREEYQRIVEDLGGTTV